MKVMMYCAISSDGYIAGRHDDISWISDEERKILSRAIKGVWNIIIGRRTYDIVNRWKFFDYFDNVFCVVMSRQNIQSKKWFHFTDAKPKNILRYLSEKWRSSTLICGGFQINKLFLELWLVEKVFVDIESVVVGDGLKFEDMIPYNVSLNMLNEYEYSSGHIQREYSVLLT